MNCSDWSSQDDWSRNIRLDSDHVSSWLNFWKTEMNYGRYFEEFNVGDVYKHWPGRTITEHDDTWFSLMTMNQNPLHIDEHYAQQTQHGRRLVNGTLIFSLAVGMSVADVKTRARNQRGEIALVFRRRVLIPKRPVSI